MYTTNLSAVQYMYGKNYMKGGRRRGEKADLVTKMVKASDCKVYPVQKFKV